MAATRSIPSTMRAMQWSSNSGGIEKHLKLNAAANLPKYATSLPKNHTLVKVAYSSLNPADFKVPELPLVSYLMFRGPSIPCQDFAGTVVATKVSHLKPGDRVFGKLYGPAWGALAEYVTVGDKGICRVPDGVSLRDAAAAGVAGLTAYQFVVTHLNPGDKVLVNGGSGGVGTFAIQMAKAAGCTVTAVCSGANAELCRSLGAEEVIDYRKHNVVDELRKGGLQYDVVYDTIFRDADLYWRAHEYLKPHGKYVNIGGDVSFQALRTSLAVLLLPSWLGGGKRKFHWMMESANAQHFAQIAALMDEGKVRPVIEDEFDIDDAAKAFQKLKIGRTRGKIAVRVSDEA